MVGAVGFFLNSQGALVELSCFRQLAGFLEKAGQLEKGHSDEGRLRAARLLPEAQGAFIERLRLGLFSGFCERDGQVDQRHTQLGMVGPEGLFIVP